MRRLPLRRERLISSIVFVAWAALCLRLVQLHVTTGDALEKLALRQHVIRETVPARPGDIVDRQGHLFATSVAVRSLYVVPARLRDAGTVIPEVARVLGLNAGRLTARVAAHPRRQFLWVKRRLGDEEAEAIRALGLPAEAWGFREEFRRFYPQGRAAAHVIGLRDVDGRGRGGIEQSFDERLRGRDGWRDLVHDARGRVIEVRERPSGAPLHGRTVVLALDGLLQVCAERALDEIMQKWKPRSACAILLDPRNGDVLAMASRPTFDPNEPGQAPPDAWNNRAITEIYEPGSTFKPFVVAQALEQKCIAPDDVFDCEQGAYRMGRRVLHDHHPYGTLSVADVLVKSSNIGMAKIGQKLTNAGLYRAAVTFGFGHRTGIELPGELPGLVRPLRAWNSYSTGSVPMGQEIAATPMQIICAYGALANGGMLIAPRIVLPEGLSDNTPASTVVSPAVDPAVADWVRSVALTAVVARGTGRKAALAGYEVFGKTGTAQKLDPRTGQYSREMHVSSFVCGAPADAPRVLVMVSVDEPTVAHNGEHFGGAIAAPPAGALLLKALERLGVQRNSELARTAATLVEEDEPALE